MSHVSPNFEIFRMKIGGNQEAAKILEMAHDAAVVRWTYIVHVV